MTLSSVAFAQFGQELKNINFHDQGGLLVKCMIAVYLLRRSFLFKITQFFTLLRLFFYQNSTNSILKLLDASDILTLLSLLTHLPFHSLNPRICLKCLYNAVIPIYPSPALFSPTLLQLSHPHHVPLSLFIHQLQLSINITVFLLKCLF